MSIQPDGQAIRNAVQWVSDRRRENPDTAVTSIVDEAAIKFDLSPVDQNFLWNTLTTLKDKPEPPEE